MLTGPAAQVAFPQLSGLFVLAVAGYERLVRTPCRGSNDWTRLRRTALPLSAEPREGRPITPDLV
jgi:hypothetical protein